MSEACCRRVRRRAGAMVGALGALLMLAAPAFAQTGSDSWTGAYFGGSLGGSSGVADMTTTTTFDPAGYFAATSPDAIAAAGHRTVRAGGVTASARAGFNVQHGQMVYGAEIDYGVMRINNGTSVTALYPCCAPTVFTVTQRTKTNWLLTIRPRVGRVAGPFLFYGTAGWALTRVNYQATFTDTFQNAMESAGIDKVDPGFAIGAGLEFRPMNRWSLGAEYLHTDFGDDRVQSMNLTAGMPPVAAPTNVFTHVVNVTSHLVRVTLRRRF